MSPNSNYFFDPSGDACIVDPAVYYGHRETDLAMTSMFGGFDSEFYAGYEDEYPLPEGWEERRPLYLLYHYLNHLNLFGTGYMSAVMSCLNHYL